MKLLAAAVLVLAVAVTVSAWKIADSHHHARPCSGYCSNGYSGTHSP